MSTKDFNDDNTFWELTGQYFIDYSEAPTTAYYLSEELKIITRNFNLVSEKRFLKLDLWNEALNTQVLFKIAQKGLNCYGIDVSKTVVQRAAEKARQRNLKLNLVVGDISSLPFQDQTFDYIYTMGTIEHSREMKKQVLEIKRVLKPGGKAIIGVPNTFDPFLRIFLIKIMMFLRLYPFGQEKSFTIKELKKLLQVDGMEAIDSGSILFLPALIRILDLFLYKNCKPLTRITNILYRPFSWLSNVLNLKRFGYMIYVIVERIN